MCEARSAHVLRTSAEKREGEGGRGTDARTEEGTEVLTERLRCRFLLYQEENELAVRPILPWHIPFHGRCAQIYLVYRIQVGPNALPDRLFPQTLEEASARHHETTLHQKLEPRPPKHFSTHFKALSNATTGYLRCYSQSANLVLFLPEMLSLRVEVVVFFSGIFGCLHFPEGSVFLASCGFFTPQPCSFLCQHRMTLPSLLLRCLCTTPDRKRTGRNQPRGDPTSPFQCGRH